MTKRLGIIVILFAFVFMITGMFIIQSGSDKDQLTSKTSAMQKSRDIKRIEEPAKKTPPKGPHPQIVFKELKYDFGKQLSGKDLTHTFVFENKGDATLIIEKVKAG